MKWIAKNQIVTLLSLNLYWELKINTHWTLVHKSLHELAYPQPLSGHLLILLHSQPPAQCATDTWPLSYSWNAPRFLLSQDLCASSLLSEIFLWLPPSLHSSHSLTPFLQRGSLWTTQPDLAYTLLPLTPSLVLSWLPHCIHTACIVIRN